MNKLIITFCVLAFFMALIEGIVSGNSAYASTRLTANVAETPATGFTLSVRSTSGFPEAGWVSIEAEKIQYNGISETEFLNCEHGYDTTDAASHIAGSMVYSPNTGSLNAALGFQIIDTGGTAGTIGIMTFAKDFAFDAMPHLIMFKHNFLQEGPLQYLRQFLLCLSIGFIFIISYMILSALGGIAQGIFRRVV